MAINLAKRGAKVTLADINHKAVQELEQRMKSERLEAAAVECDVSSVESVNKSARIAEEVFGPVDILVNNAGIVSGRKLLENNEKAIEKTLVVNTLAHTYTVRAFLPGMIKRDSGHIVTIASCAGLVGVAGLADYCASKFGAFGFDETMRMELKTIGSKVKTTCICPYYINTGMFDGVQSRFSCLLPILDQNYAVNKKSLLL